MYEEAYSIVRGCRACFDSEFADDVFFRGAYFFNMGDFRARTYVRREIY